jgi:hypothetical protein
MSIVNINPYRQPMIPWGNGQYNKLYHLMTGLDIINAIPICSQSSKSFNLETGDIVIKYRNENFSLEIITCNAPNSTKIEIRQYKDDTYIWNEIHHFEPNKFSGYVSNYLLTPAEREQYKMFQKQEQDRKDALEKALEEAHNSKPQTCDFHDCKYCQEEYNNMLKQQGIIIP